MTGFIIDTPEGINAYRLLSMRAMLSIQINTGLKNSRGSVMNLVRDAGISNKRTLLGVWNDLNDYIGKTLGPEMKRPRMERKST